MFPAASRMYFAMAVAAVLSGGFFAVATGDRGGFTLLVVTGVVAVVLALGVFAFVAPDTAALPLGGGATGDDDPEPVAAPVAPAGFDDPPRPSIWPVAVAGALCLLAVGAAVGMGVALAGFLLGVIAAFSWLGQVWREHESWTRGMIDRLNERYIIPIGLPGTVVALIGIGVVSFSRLLLAVSKNAATLVALVAALAILGGCAFVAARPRMGRSALGALATFSGVLVVAAGVAGALKGEREFEHHGAEAAAIELAAKDLAFDKAQLDLPAGEVEIAFHNADTVRHNLAILPEGQGEPIFRGEIIDGGATTTYRFEGPPAGSYRFVCDIHPSMKGTVVVSADSSEPSEPAPPGEPAPASGPAH